MVAALVPFVPLSPENTREVGHLHQRLAMGVQWHDAMTGQPADGRWLSALARIGARVHRQPFVVHPQARHAVRHGGRLAAVLAKAAAEKATVPPADPSADPTNFELSAWGAIDPGLDGYRTSNDPRRFVPRRLSLTPVQTAGVPVDTIANTRTALLWPGAGYPVQAGTTALRGRIRRGPAPDRLVPVAWARVVITRPAAIPDFDTEIRLGYAHGDDRGEFIALLGPAAVTAGVDLPASLALRVWVFLPPADGFDPDAPLASLPLEFAGTAQRSAVLDGTAPPDTYLRRGPVDVIAPLGRVLTLNDSDLTFT